MKYQDALDLISSWQDLWPQTFSVYEGRRRPLKLGIHKDLIATGVVTEAEAAGALWTYCNNRGYLLSCREGQARVGLDGNIVGVVTAAEAANSAASLKAWRAKRAAKTNGASAPATVAPAAPKAATVAAAKVVPPTHRSPTPPPTSPAKPKRLGLSDLREAWRQRQAGLQP